MDLFEMLDMDHWKIINKKDPDILSIYALDKHPYFSVSNRKLLNNDSSLCNEIQEKLEDDESWAVITFEYDIKRTFRYEFSDDDHIFLIERSTIKYVCDGQTPESSLSVKADTDKIINYLQDKNNHFVRKEGSKMTDIEIRLR